jgi:hypothetical protein
VRVRGVLVVAVWASLPVIGACKPPPPVVAPPPPPVHREPSLGERLDAARAATGDILLVSDEVGIDAYTPDGKAIATVTRTGGRHLRVDRDSHALYFFAGRQLVRLDLARGGEQEVATLPVLHHRCFWDNGDGVDPTEFIQAEDRDFSVDVHGGSACVVAQDRNLMMLSVAITYRIDLATGAIEQATTTALPDCREPGETGSATPPCSTQWTSPRDPPAKPWPHSPTEVGLPEWGETSASGRWMLFRVPELGEMGDHIYAPLFLFDRTTGTTYAIEPAQTAVVDFPQLKQAGTPVENACMLPGEARTLWLPHAEALIVEGCNNNGGAMIVAPPSGVRALPGREFAIY